MQKDNSTFPLKRSLRVRALRLIDNPVVMESHGGFGKLYAACYSTIAQGVVFEKDPVKSEYLARQRPTWSVYEGDCVRAIAAGAGSHLPVNFLDCDPYGEAWPVIRAFIESDRPKPDRLVIVVNDGSRQNLKLQRAWGVHSMSDVMLKYGNARCYEQYKEICREMIATMGHNAGWTLQKFASYYCGNAKAMTHWAALLTR